MPAKTASAVADAQQTAHSRRVLEKHHWRFTLKNHQIHDYNGIAVVKRAGNQRLLEMRIASSELQVDLNEVESAARVAERTVLGNRNKSNIMTICFNPDVPCDGGDPLPTDLGCDPTVSFCCPVRGAFGSTVPCADIPEIPDGAGCEFNEICGDDHSGNPVGVGFLAFAYRYCWVNFQTFDTSCFLGTIPFPFFNHGENLYRFWSLDLPYAATLLCKPPSNAGWGFANYEDHGTTPTHYGFETKHVLGRDTLPESIVSWMYPNDFLFGRFPVTSQATMRSNFYRTGVPLGLAGNQLGYCNFDRA